MSGARAADPRSRRRAAYGGFYPRWNRAVGPDRIRRVRTGGDARSTGLIRGPILGQGLELMDVRIETVHVLLGSFQAPRGSPQALKVLSQLALQGALGRASRRFRVGGCRGGIADRRGGQQVANAIERRERTRTRRCKPAEAALNRLTGRW
jgi:hypothetical protein